LADSICILNMYGSSCLTRLLSLSLCKAGMSHTDERMAERVLNIFNLSGEDLLNPGKHPNRVKARSVLAHLGDRAGPSGYGSWFETGAGAIRSQSGSR